MLKGVEFHQDGVDAGIWFFGGDVAVPPRLRAAYSHPPRSPPGQEVGLQRLNDAGGHLVAMLGTSGDVKELEGDLGNPGISSRVQAVCDFCGPTDFTVIDKFPNGAVKPVTQLLGGPVAENLEKAKTANPITYITKDDPPFLIMHGDQDRTVPVNQSELLNEALKKAGVWVEFEPVKGGGHGFGGPEITKTVNEFFDEKLKAKK